MSKNYFIKHRKEIENILNQYPDTEVSGIIEKKTIKLLDIGESYHVSQSLRTRDAKHSWHTHPLNNPDTYFTFSGADIYSNFFEFLRTVFVSQVKKKYYYVFSKEGIAMCRIKRKGELRLKENKIPQYAKLCEDLKNEYEKTIVILLGDNGLIGDNMRSIWEAHITLLKNKKNVDELNTKFSNIVDNIFTSIGKLSVKFSFIFY